MIGNIIIITIVGALVLALSGAYTSIIKQLQKVKNKDKESAKRYLNEVLKDFCYKRSLFKLENSYFPMCLKNDISVYLTQTEFEQWEKRFYMISQKAEDSGITTEGLPYYSIVLPNANEDSISIYESMIRTNCINILTLAHCAETQVIINWYATNDKRYSTCRIVYARTALEKDSFIEYAAYLDQRYIGKETEEINDPELDKEISIYKEIEHDE